MGAFQYFLLDVAGAWLWFDRFLQYSIFPPVDPSARDIKRYVFTRSAFALFSLVAEDLGHLGQ